MSLPSRFSVWSASSAPGTAGSGICFTQTTTFMALLLGAPACDLPARRDDSGQGCAAGTSNRDKSLSLRASLACPAGLRPRRPLGERRPQARGRRAVPSTGDGRWSSCGAGPAGTAAAITAARRGLASCCFDRARFPRDKTCGDGLTTQALRLLEELGLSRADARALPDISRCTSASSCRRAAGGRDLPLPTTATTPASSPGQVSTPRSSPLRAAPASTSAKATASTSSSSRPTA